MFDLWHRCNASAIAEPKQQEALFSLVSIPGNRRTNGITVEPTLQKKKNRGDTEGKEGKEGEW